jgi:class 3 adenylate cyclase
VYFSEDRLPLHIGRQPSSDVQVDDPAVSRRHCRLVLRRGRLQLDDQSLNGTLVREQLVRGGCVPIPSRTCLVLGSTLLWLAPLDKEGNPIGGVDPYAEPESPERHGICFVDICDSTAKNLAEVSEIGEVLRRTLVGQRPDEMLMLKSLGDGYLAIYRTPDEALSAAERLLRRCRDWEAEHGIRIALDAGPTFRSHGHDRMGMAINRAARLEKLQRADITHPGRRLHRLHERNRCLASADVRRAVGDEVRRRFLYLGRCALKGFGQELFPVYQYQAALS